MKVIVCIDDNKGILFNKRRVSKDSKIIEDIQSYSDIIYLEEYSKNLFNNRVVSSLNKDGYNFVETNSLKNMENEIEEIIVYYFNRRYPSDLKLELDLSKYNIISSEEFAGTSHEKITKIIYRRNS